MSLKDDFKTALTEFHENLVRRAVEETIDRIGSINQNEQFIQSQECARLMGVTPEHLCAMRSRNEGPPWSGEGKWVRYRRLAVIDWLANLPRTSTHEQKRGGVR